MNHLEADTRRHALDLAAGLSAVNTTPEGIIRCAEKFLKFLQGEKAEDLLESVALTLRRADAMLEIFRKEKEEEENQKENSSN